MTQTRTTDPATSHANENPEAAGRAAGFVRGLMRDGHERTDADIYAALRGMGVELSPQRIRAGRVGLSRAGWLIEVGTRRTEYGGKTRVWRMA